ncbi:CBS domain-containing protein [Desulfonatronum thioautotrophicum]|uniref:CBS domain-containing protein n=1 Tax=Desulfonatronum thioautotrophicum TaxID=617001 RepID=UPI001ABF0DDF|nr:CBS domain-containing protein [Desulfonatronum thioautotrophicum]
MAKSDQCGIMDFSEEDVLEAMRAMQGYVDITPGAFREIYRAAYEQALKRMAGAKKAREIMTSPAYCLQRNMTATEAAMLLADHGISGAPVVDTRGKVCGVVSGKDFLRVMGLPNDSTFMRVVAQCLDKAGCCASGLQDLPLDALMSSPPITANEDISVADISALFMAKAINRLPICGTDGHPKGIVTRTDLIGALCMRG